MGGIPDSKEDAMESITSKWVMRVFTVLLIVLLQALVLIMLFDSATEWVGNLLGIQNNKTKTVQFIGWAMGEVSIAIGLVLLIWRSEFKIEYDKFVQQKYMRKIIDFMKRIIDSITGKRIIFGSTVLLVVLFAGLMSAIFFNSAAEWVGNLFDIKNNKTETIQFIGWIMSGALAVIGLVVLSRWWAKFRVYLGYMRKIVDFMNRITSKQIVVGCAFLLVVLFAVLILVAFFDSVERRVWDFLFGSSIKIDIIRLVGWAMSGTSLVIVLVALNRRAEAQVENNTLVESGHRQDRFKAATEHLGSQKSSIRISAFYEFLHLANDNQGKYQKSILEILYVYIRTTTTASEYGNKASESSESKTANDELKTVTFEANDEPKSPEEIQVLLDGLFKSEATWRDKTNPNLQGVYLAGANLFNADLSRADLSGADLSEADLSRANLSGADLSRSDLSKARLRRAKLPKARLQDANLSKAKLGDANLFEAKLPGANFSGADLSRVNLSSANLFRANLFEVILRNANLSKANLRSADFSGANLSGADLSDASLFGANLLEADLPGARLSGADLSRADLSRARLSGVDLSGARLSGANLSGARLSGANLSGANLSGANLSGIDLSGTDLSEVGLFRTNLSEANLSGVNLSGVNLSEANLSGTDLSKAGLFGADLTGARLFGADLTGADLTGADLTGVDLTGVDLTGADLSGAQLKGAQHTNETRFPEWLALPIVPPDNGDKVQFPEGFVAPEKPKKPKNDE